MHLMVFVVIFFGTVFVKNKTFTINKFYPLLLAVVAYFCHFPSLCPSIIIYFLFPLCCVLASYFFLKLHSYSQNTLNYRKQTPPLNAPRDNCPPFQLQFLHHYHCRSALEITSRPKSITTPSGPLASASPTGQFCIQVLRSTIPGIGFHCCFQIFRISSFGNS